MDQKITADVIDAVTLSDLSALVSQDGSIGRGFHLLLSWYF